MPKLIGIDLGTVNSRVAVLEGRVPWLIPNQEGMVATPTVVAFTPTGERLVGQSAKDQAAMNPGRTISAIPRLLGRRFSSPEVEQMRRFLGCPLVEGPTGEVCVQIDDKVYSAPEIVSFVLKKLKAAAEDHLGEPVGEAIITIPAHCDLAQRRSINAAARLAGLEVARMYRDSTAAALNYGLKNAEGYQLVAVYALGGGAFAITIVEMADGLFQVRATGGDSFLGGEDFDQRIVDWLISEFLRETSVDLRQDRMALQRLKEVAEKAKCGLSTTQQADIELPFLWADTSGSRHLNTVLTRQKYESLTEDLLERTIAYCMRCLFEAGLQADQLDKVLLVGGQTHAPQIPELVRRVFGKEAHRAVLPEEGVVMGAAIEAGIITGELKDLVLLDVTPHTLGLETKDGSFTPVVERNSVIPARKSRVFTTVADNQTRLEVHVLEGESDLAASNTSLARFELANIPSAPKGTEQIEVVAEIDVRGVITVKARDESTGRDESVVIDPFDPHAGIAWVAPAPLRRPAGEARSLVLLNVTPHALGIEHDGAFVPVIERNRRTPARGSRVFTTPRGDPTRFVVHVLMGESDLADYNKSLGRFELTNLPPVPEGVPRIEVTFGIDEEWVVTVRARDQDTGISQSTVIRLPAPSPSPGRAV